MMQGDPFRVDIILFMLSVGSRYARTHGYYKGDAFGVINHMHKIHLRKNLAKLLRKWILCPNFAGQG